MKKVKFITAFIIILLSFIIHFAYDLFPNSITSIIFPINESIWEHMKIIATSIMFASILEAFIYKYKNIKHNNLIISIPIVSIICIILYLFIYLTINLFIPHNLYISIILLVLIFILGQMISYKILKNKKICSNEIGILFLILLYSAFGILTYYPIKNNLFIDPTNNTYGIKKESK